MPLKTSEFRFLGTLHLILVLFALLFCEALISSHTLIALEWSDYNERTCTYNIVFSLILTQVKNIYSYIQVTRNIINDDSIYRINLKKNDLHTSFRSSRGIFIKWWIWAFCHWLALWFTWQKVSIDRVELVTSISVQRWRHVIGNQILTRVTVRSNHSLEHKRSIVRTLFHW